MPMIEFDFLPDVLKESIVLTLTVTALMFIIEAVNITSKGRMFSFLHRKTSGQVLLSSLLGAVPGCLGGYFTVSMYSKKMFSFGALLAMAIATTGDEAFVMLASFPKQALLIFAGLLLAGIAAGLIYDRFNQDYISRDVAECDCSDEDISEHKSLKHKLLHTAKHGVRIFAWTFGVMALIGIIDQMVDLESWVSGNVVPMIILASLIGCIPQSGPHMVFVSLYASGILPLPILLASCVSQDGHAGLPLIAASKKDFFRLKGIKFILGIAVGLIALIF